MEDALGPVDVTEVTVPTLLEMPGLGLTVAAYTDGFDHCLAHDELREIADMTRDRLPRLVPRRAGGWQVETTPTRPQRAPGGAGPGSGYWPAAFPGRRPMALADGLGR